MKQIKSHDYPEIYKSLDIDLSKLGCVMLDVELGLGEYGIAEMVELEIDLYYAQDKTRFWIDGFVGTKTAHLTLLYGLMKPAYEYRSYIEKILEGYRLESIDVDSIGFFNSPYPDEPYYCIVAHIKVTPELMEGHQRLELLPHVNTFVGYKPHVTLAYIKKDEILLKKWLDMLDKYLVGKKIPVKPVLNLGDKK